MRCHLCHDHNPDIVRIRFGIVCGQWIRVEDNSSLFEKKIQSKRKTPKWICPRFWKFFVTCGFASLRGSKFCLTIASKVSNSDLQKKSFSFTAWPRKKYCKGEKTNKNYLTRWHQLHLHLFSPAIAFNQRPQEMLRGNCFHKSNQNQTSHFSTVTIYLTWEGTNPRKREREVLRKESPNISLNQIKPLSTKYLTWEGTDPREREWEVLRRNHQTFHSIKSNL